MAKTIKIDRSSFNASHFAGWTESEFIRHELASVPDSYGSKSNKKEFLKTAFAAIKEANEKPK